MPVNPNDDRADRAIRVAVGTFWASLADSYPELQTGDVEPRLLARFEDMCESVARYWIEKNGADLVFSHDQLAKLAAAAQSASLGSYGGNMGHGTCYAINARQGEPADRRYFGAAHTPVDARDMVIEVRWLDRHGHEARTMILVRQDGGSTEYDQ